MRSLFAMLTFALVCGGADLAPAQQPQPADPQATTQTLPAQGSQSSPGTGNLTTPPRGNVVGPNGGDPGDPGGRDGGDAGGTGGAQVDRCPTTEEELAELELTDPELAALCRQRR